MDNRNSSVAVEITQMNQKNIKSQIADLIAQIPEGDGKERWQRAYKYATETLTQSEANTMGWALEDTERAYGLSYLSAEEVEDTIREHYDLTKEQEAEIADVSNYIARRIAGQFESNSTERDFLLGWAREAFEERYEVAEAA
jgi:hypothetical protein